MRVAFTGKDGSGKTTLSALFARHLARSGANAPAVDGDVNQHRSPRTRAAPPALPGSTRPRPRTAQPPGRV
ncbi:adenylyl-sulfate kinase [Streptomyces scabiei]|uniref:adenylyl-sulfate kinase n=1 Tax=Streptomyces scabiei TaxID=1930 RepID=UPI0039F59B5A